MDLYDNNYLERLSDLAKASPRLRQSLDLRNSPKDNSQRMLNALEPGTILKIHRHPASSTTTIILRGSIRLNIYNDDGAIKESFVLKPGTVETAFYQIPQNAWHNLECLESGTVIFEGKDGIYDPGTDTEFFEQ